LHSKLVFLTKDAGSQQLTFVGSAKKYLEETAGIAVPNIVENIRNVLDLSFLEQKTINNPSRLIESSA
jgi:hypothetical protein